MNVDELTGRALDVAVARRVFGYEVEERANTRTGENDAVYRITGTDWVRVPFYSTSLAASAQIELELQKTDWKRQEVRARVGTSPVARVVLEHADGRTVGAFGSENEALCRAALRYSGFPPRRPIADQEAARNSEYWKGWTAPQGVTCISLSTFTRANRGPNVAAREDGS